MALFTQKKKDTTTTTTQSKESAMLMTKMSGSCMPLSLSVRRRRRRRRRAISAIVCLYPYRRGAARRVSVSIGGGGCKRDRHCSKSGARSDTAFKSSY